MSALRRKGRRGLEQARARGGRAVALDAAAQRVRGGVRQPRDHRREHVRRPAQVEACAAFVRVLVSVRARVRVRVHMRACHGVCV